MFQPILTIIIVTVNMGWNTGFSLVADLNKGCSLLTMLKLNVWQGVCSSVRLDTDILIGTSVLNCQTLKIFFSKFQYSKWFFQENWVVYFFSPLSVGKIWVYMVRSYCIKSDFRCQLACYSPNHPSKQPSGTFYLIKSCVY